MKKLSLFAASFLFLSPGCPKDPELRSLDQAPLEKITPLVAPKVALLPEEKIRDIATTKTATWVATEGPLLRIDANGGITRLGPKEGLEYGEAVRLASDGANLAIAGKRGLYVFQENELKRVPLPNDPLLSGYQPTHLAFRNGELWAIFGPQLSTLPLLCGESTSETVLPKVFRLTAKGAVPLSVPSAPKAIAVNPEGVWVASGNKLFVLENGFSQFREMALDKGADIHKLQVDPKGRIWALTDQGLFGGTAKAGVESIDGGNFFAGPREALGLGFSGNNLWIVTARSLYLFDGKEWQRFEYKREDGVKNTAVGVQPDAIFIGSTQGLIAGKPGAWKYLIEDGEAPPGAVRAFTNAIGKILIGTANESGFELNSGGLKQAIDDKETEELIGNAKPSEILGVKPKISKPTNDPKGSSPRSAIFQQMELPTPTQTSVGIYAFKPGETPFFIDSGLSSGILALQQARDGNLWVAGRRGVRQLRVDGTFFAPEEMESIGARAITTDKKGSLWFAASDAPTGRGLGLHGRILASWLSFTTQDGMPSNEIYALAAQGTNLFVAQPGGITQVSEKGITTTKLPTPIFQIEATGNNIWAAGCQDVFKYDGQNWSNYLGMPNGVALAMVTDAKGRLIAGNRSGLYMFQEQSSTWSYLPGAGGIGVSTLQIIPEEDGKETLWIGAESGAVIAIPIPD
jgi:streptogramin lyase